MTDQPPPSPPASDLHKQAQAARAPAGRFAKGASGNPDGKAPGTRNGTTLALEALLEGEAEAITRKAIEMAKAGDPHAVKLLIERILPARRGRPVRFDLPEIEGAADITKAHGSILRACAAGALTPEEGTLIANVLDAKRRSIETEEIARRLDALEQAQDERGAR